MQPTSAKTFFQENIKISRFTKKMAIIMYLKDLYLIHGSTERILCIYYKDTLIVIQ